MNFLINTKRVQHFFAMTAILFVYTAKAQLYFPPNDSDEWETISPSSLDWCEQKIDSLNTFLASNNTKAFILIKDGKIVLEEYYNDHTPQSNWYWASAGKTLKAFAVGIAQQENSLAIEDPVSDYLGQGWTSCTESQEENITIYHQLSMTTGLDDGVDDLNCTESACLQFHSPSGTRWAYHNAPYTLLDDVLEDATGQNLNFYITQKIKNPTGMDGLYIPLEDTNTFFSTARSMTRFGLLILNNGNWNGNQILTDDEYFTEMVNSSQDLNESYGYLWWLNGKESFMIPQSQIVFDGSMVPNAPDDMVAAMGKNGQFINVVPSTNMVWIRMGDAPDDSLVSFTLNNEIWAYLNELECDPLSTQDSEDFQSNIEVYPNPTKGKLVIETAFQNLQYTIMNSRGQIQQKGVLGNELNISHLAEGIYFLKLTDQKDTKIIRVVKN